MGENVRQLNVSGPFRKLQQGFMSGTVDALRIGKVFMHHTIKGVEQFFFGVHSARPSRTWSPSVTAMFTQQNPTIRSRCR